MDTRVQLNAPGGPLAIIRAQGADAVKFLQGQLTQDVALLGLSEARLAAWCSAKGRMLASFVLLKNTHEDILLICSASVLPATLKRLQMFVLRAQCKLSDATAEFELLGLAGDAAHEGAGVAPDLIAAPAIFHWAVARKDTPNGAEITVHIPPAHPQGQALPRALRLRPAGTAAAAPADADALATWSYLEVTSGIAPITQPIVDAFVPQMLNYESTGGVNFKKGCYPGQEVVARSQFRGTLKRRAYVVHGAGPLAAGQEVFDSRNPEQPCGTVACAAPEPPFAPGGPWLAIVSMQVSAADSPRLAAGSADGQALALQPLPYALLADI